MDAFVRGHLDKYLHDYKLVSCSVYRLTLTEVQLKPDLLIKRGFPIWIAEGRVEKIDIVVSLASLRVIANVSGVVILLEPSFESRGIFTAWRLQQAQKKLLIESIEAGLHATLQHGGSIAGTQPSNVDDMSLLKGILRSVISKLQVRAVYNTTVQISLWTRVHFRNWF
jgi:hypothetical protein